MCSIGLVDLTEVGLELVLIITYIGLGPRIGLRQGCYRLCHWSTLTACLHFCRPIIGLLQVDQIINAFCP